MRRRKNGTPTTGIKLRGRKRTNSAIWRKENGEYIAEEVGFPSDLTKFGALGSRIRAGAMSS